VSLRDGSGPECAIWCLCPTVRSIQESGHGHDDHGGKVGLRSTHAAQEFEPLRIHLDFSRVDTNGGEPCLVLAQGMRLKHARRRVHVGAAGHVF